MNARIPLRRQTKLFERVRRERIATLIAGRHIADEGSIPAGAIPAAMELQAPQNTYGPKVYYQDLPFTCYDCGKREIWTAEQQMHWYEVAKGNINSTAIRCHACRRIWQAKRELQRKKSLDGYTRKKKKD